MIQDIAKDRAVLISTHILPEVQAVCDYIMMIEHGQKVFEGTINAFNTYMSPSALLDDYAQRSLFGRVDEDRGSRGVERLTNTRIRLHFKWDDSIIETGGRTGGFESMAFPGDFFGEGSWIRCLPNCPGKDA